MVQHTNSDFSASGRTSAPDKLPIRLGATLSRSEPGRSEATALASRVPDIGTGAAPDPHRRAVIRVSTLEQPASFVACGLDPNSARHNADGIATATQLYNVCTSSMPEPP